MDIIEEINELIGKKIAEAIPSVRDGIDGEKGDRGDRGEPGKDGKDGRDSTVPGPKGDKGDTVVGPMGPPGRDGKDGKDGAIDEATIAYLEDKIAAVQKDVKKPMVIGSSGVKKLVAGTNVTIDETNLEYPVINVSGGPGGEAVWGGITGTLSTQTDLQSALDGKAATGHTHTGVYAPALGADDNYVTDAEKAALHAHSNKTALDNVSGVNTGDQDLSGYSLTSHNHTGTYAPALGADDNYVTDAEKTKLANLSGTNTGDNATNTQYSGLAASKQDALVSGTNIKTVNGTSLLGSGDVTISGSGLTALQVASLISIRF